MTSSLAIPAINKASFTCPYCGLVSQMVWQIGQYHDPKKNGWISCGVLFARCSACGKDTFWLQENGRMIHPVILVAPTAHPDMPSDARKEFEEARQVASYSPRAAAALLRLAIQRLCVFLGGSGNNLNDDIAKLVQNGLPVEIRNALDIVRVIGNNAIHPGEIDAKDIAEVSNNLFDLVNAIVEDRISRPKKLAELYGKLPKGARDAIEKRDRTKGEA